MHKNNAAVVEHNDIAVPGALRASIAVAATLLRPQGPPRLPHLPCPRLVRGAVDREGGRGHKRTPPELVDIIRPLRPRAARGWREGGTEEGGGRRGEGGETLCRVDKLTVDRCGSELRAN